MYKIGDRVQIISDNDNYDNYRDKILIVQNISTSESDTCIYDENIGGQLMDFTTENGDEVPFSLYEYEIEKLIN